MAKTRSQDKKAPTPDNRQAQDQSNAPEEQVPSSGSEGKAPDSGDSEASAPGQRRFPAARRGEWNQRVANARRARRAVQEASTSRSNRTARSNVRVTGTNQQVPVTPVQKQRQSVSTNSPLTDFESDSGEDWGGSSSSDVTTVAAFPEVGPRDPRRDIDPRYLYRPFTRLPADDPFAPQDPFASRLTRSTIGTPRPYTIPGVPLFGRAPVVDLTRPRPGRRASVPSPLAAYPLPERPRRPGRVWYPGRRSQIFGGNTPPISAREWPERAPAATAQNDVQDEEMEDPIPDPIQEPIQDYISVSTDEQRYHGNEDLIRRPRWDYLDRMGDGPHWPGYENDSWSEDSYYGYEGPDSEEGDNEYGGEGEENEEEADEEQEEAEEEGQEQEAVDAMMVDQDLNVVRFVQRMQERENLSSVLTAHLREENERLQQENARLAQNNARYREVLDRQFREQRHQAANGFFGALALEPVVQEGDEVVDEQQRARYRSREWAVNRAREWTRDNEHRRQASPRRSRSPAYEPQTDDSSAKAAPEEMDEHQRARYRLRDQWARNRIREWSMNRAGESIREAQHRRQQWRRRSRSPAYETRAYQGPIFDVRPHSSLPPSLRANPLYQSLAAEPVGLGPRPPASSSNLAPGPSSSEVPITGGQYGLFRPRPTAPRSNPFARHQIHSTAATYGPSEAEDGVFLVPRNSPEYRGPYPDDNNHPRTL